MKTDWKKKLTPEQYSVLREKGTELPFTGEYIKTKKKGIYTCVGCGSKLFNSKTKFDSGCGWPSFYDTNFKDNIKMHDDNNLWMKRTEVICAKCNGHLGHIFNDGPKPTGLRYCINSVALKLKENKKQQKTL